MKFTSAREAICYYLNHQLMTPENDISQLFVKVQHTARGGSGRMWLGLELGDMCRDLNERNLGKAAYTWALYAYGGDSDPKVWSGLQKELLLIRYLLENSPKKVTAANVKKLSALAKCAIEDFALLDVTGRKRHTAAHVCREVGIQQANWARTWEDLYLELQDSLDRLAAKCLGVVSVRLNSTRTEAA